MADNNADSNVSLGTGKFLSKEQCRILILFGFETQDGRASPLWRDPSSFIKAQGKEAQALDKSFQEWLQKKRPFTEDEVVNKRGFWEKTNDDTGEKHEIRLLADGNLEENNYGSRRPSWEGKWRLIDGVLRIMINDYELDVFAAEHGSTHSGVNYVEYDEHRPITYFTMVYHE